jgi:predicted glycosyltransferase involved in capsule biosynthesis
MRIDSDRSSAANGLGLIVSWRDRPELEQAIPALVTCAKRYGGDVTIVNYGGSTSELLRMIASSLASIRVVEVTGERWFNKARAQNIGAAHAPQSLLFFCDCDILVQVGALDDLVAAVQADDQIFGTVAGVTETQLNARNAGNVVMFGYELKLRLSNGRSLRIVDNEEDAEDGSRQAPGLLLVRRSAFEQVGGYNGQLHGWGWEDQDMIARLTLAGGLARVQLGHVQHISHDDDARIRNYPPVKDRWGSRDRMFRQALSNYDCGDFMGTFRQDGADLATRQVVDSFPGNK